MLNLQCSYTRTSVERVSGGSCWNPSSPRPADWMSAYCGGMREAIIKRCFT
jgi:hypothetical protein